MLDLWPVKTATIECLPECEDYQVSYSTKNPVTLACMFGSFAAQLLVNGILTGDDLLCVVEAAIDSEQK